MILADRLDLDARIGRFGRICDAAMRERREQGTDGIGTLSEKWQHQIIKRYLSEDTSEHEVRVSEDRRFVSDVRVGDHAYEVQTGAFAPMREKIAYYLEQTALDVTIVHPIPKNKTVCWIDPATQEISEPKRSPRHGRLIDLLPELYPLIPYLARKRLHFRVLLLEVCDFRILSNDKRNRKHRAERFERIPTALCEDVSFDTPADFQVFLPEELPSVFTVKQFSVLTKLRGRDAYSAVRVLVAMGLLAPAEKIGRSMAFERQ